MPATSSDAKLRFSADELESPPSPWHSHSLSLSRPRRERRARLDTKVSRHSVPVAEKAAGHRRNELDSRSLVASASATLSPGLISAHAHPRKAPSVYSVIGSAHDILLRVVGAQVYMRLFDLQFKFTSFSAYDRSLTQFHVFSSSLDDGKKYFNELGFYA